MNKPAVAPTKYSRHLSERAAQILTRRQSAIFNQLQDDLLAGLRAHLLQEEAAVANRR